MSNKSFSIKENPYMKDIQGGEKKVMKKILSVALSTAMAFSMFASVAFGADAEKLTPEQQFNVLKEAGIVQGYPDGLSHLDRTVTRAELAKIIVKSMALEEVTGVASYKDKNYTAKHWAAPFIEAATQAKILEGVSTNPANPLFNPTGNVTVQELAKVLVEANKLEVPTDATNTASDWAKGYVAAAIKAGYIAEGINYQANATRAQTVVAAHAIYEFNNFKVTKAEAKDSTNVTLTLSTGEVVEVKLETPLKANEKTDLVYKAKDGRELKYSVTWVVTTATKVESAASTNLKEVEVTFDGEVDKATATDKENYSINQGAKKIKSVTLLEGGKSVRILLDGATFLQGTDYTIQVKNVKAGTAVLSTASVKFTSADNTLPTVTEVKALGNKAIKVTFSEPLRNVVANNFRLDDKAFVGNVNKGANEREVILKDYAGSLTIGAHKLTVQLVEDYAGLKSLAATTDFTVAEDKEAPTVASISATLEKMTVTFSEDIDPDSVKSDTFYWKSGDTKKVGKYTQVSGNVYEVDFTANRLPGYETTVFIDGVKDYSGNEIAVKEHKVTATVDLNRPKVSDVTFGINGKNTLTVKYDKAVAAGDRGNYTVKKGDDVYPVTGISYVSGSDQKAVNLTFASTLPDGDYSLKVTGIKDLTALGNMIEDYSTTFRVDDVLAPAVKTVDVNAQNRSVVLSFNKKMDLSTLENHSNYYIQVTTTGNMADAVNKSLPEGTLVRPVLEGRAVVLVFPEHVQGEVRTSFRTTETGTASIKNVTVTGLKSAAGNYLTAAAATSEIIAGSTVKATKAEQTDYRTIKVTFNQPISQAYAGDFALSNGYVTSATIESDGYVVVLKTDRDLANYSTGVTINASNAIRTYADNTVAAGYINSVTTAAPKVTLNSLNYTKTGDVVKFAVPFTSSLLSNPDDLYGFDLIVRKDDDKNTPPLVFKTDFTTKRSSTGSVNEIEVEIPSALKDYNGRLTVQVRDGAQYIKSLNGVAASKSDVIPVNLSGDGFDAGTAIASKQFVQGVDEVKAADPVAATTDLQGITVSAVTAGTAGNTISIAVTVDADAPAKGITATVTGDAVTVAVDQEASLDEVIGAINGLTGANKIVKATLASGFDGTTPIVPTTAKTLTGGEAAKTASPAVQGQLKLTFTSKERIQSLTAVELLNGTTVVHTVKSADVDKITYGSPASDGTITSVVTLKLPTSVVVADVTSIKAYQVNGNSTLTN
jgi:hypothetical protein